MTQIFNALYLMFVWRPEAIPDPFEKVVRAKRAPQPDLLPFNRGESSEFEFHGPTGANSANADLTPEEIWDLQDRGLWMKKDNTLNYQAKMLWASGRDAKRIAAMLKKKDPSWAEKRVAVFNKRKILQEKVPS